MSGNLRPRHGCGTGCNRGRLCRRARARAVRGAVSSDSKWTANTELSVRGVSAGEEHGAAEAVGAAPLSGICAPQSLCPGLPQSSLHADSMRCPLPAFNGLCVLVV